MVHPPLSWATGVSSFQVRQQFGASHQRTMKPQPLAPLICVLLFGAFLARSASAIGTEAYRRSEAPSDGQRHGMGVEVFTRLGIRLNQKQKDALGPIMAESKRKIREIRSNLQLNTMQKNKRLMAIHAQRSQQIRQILTADQWKDFISRMPAR